jgi:hypothetical protein
VFMCGGLGTRNPNGPCFMGFLYHSNSPVRWAY